MPAEGKITLNSKQYEATLEAVRAKTGRAAGDMSRSVRNFGKDVGGAGKAVAAMSSEVGSQFGTVGRVISSLASGPVALLTAAFGALLAAGVKMYDHLTLSAEEYQLKLSAQIELENKRLSKLKEEQKAENDYMDRLIELSNNETNSNTEKTEAVRLIEILTKRYGDLGISIDETTGKITGLAEAEEKLNEKQRQLAEKQLENVIGLKKDEIASSVRGELLPQGFEKVLNVFSGGSRGRNAKEAAAIFTSLSPQAQLEHAQNIIWGNEQLEISASENKEEIQFWNEQIKKINEVIELEDRLNSLRKTGSETIDDETAALEAASKQERAIDEALEKFFEGVEEEERKLADAERQRAEERFAAEQKITDEYQKELDAARELEKQNRYRKEQRLVGQVFGLRDAALRATGQAERADIDAAVWAATQAKGSALDQDEYNKTVEMASLKYQLNQAMQNRAAGGVDFAPRVNSLVARGGSEAPVKMPGVESLQAKSLAQQEKIARITDQIFNRMNDWMTI